ncbi:MAG: DUF1566 domain-containing protein [Arenicella sp.]|nr:DUF1566 domain-containing protein [Arenicella sp.]
MLVFTSRAFIALYILLCVSSAYGHNQIVVIPMCGDDTPTYSIGETGPAGGIVFYTTDRGRHGLEAAAADSTSSEWGCYEDFIGGTSLAIGTGAANTAAIVAGCVSAQNTAAEVANAYELNSFADWFLPSRGELNLLYLQKDVVGSFGSFYYWSSSESNSFVAWDQNFGDGSQFDGNKNSTLGVRAVRAF